MIPQRTSSNSPYQKVSQSRRYESFSVCLHNLTLSQVYVDTVGPPDKYERLLSRAFPDLQITVSKKADSIYPIVSAASICAKVLRDHALHNWQFKEKRVQVTRVFGSGYPGGT